MCVAVPVRARGRAALLASRPRALPALARARRARFDAGVDVDDTLAATQADLFWLPRDARVIERPELLYLAAPRDAGYLNVALRIDPASARLPALVAEVAAAHAPFASRFMLAARSRGPSVERALEEAGYAREHEHFGYAVRVEAFRPRPSPGVVVRRVARMEELRDALDVAARAFGRADTSDAATLDAELAACTRPGGRVHRFVAYDAEGGGPLASAGLNAHPALRFGFLWAGGTVPEARGRGAYSALVAARVAAARALGLEAVGLYARVGASAPIVEKQGFERHGPMTYWLRPGAAGGST
jgi:hypothetical protein